MFFRKIVSDLSSRLLTNSCVIGSRNRFNYNYNLNSSGYSNPHQEVIVDTSAEDKLKSDAIIRKVNEHIASGEHGRLFAIIYILGKAYRVTPEDIIVIERNWYPQPGDYLRFEKVMLVAGSSFTLIGKPILPQNLVSVTGCITQKDLGHTKITHKRRKKKRDHHTNFTKEHLTFIRINKIEVSPKLNEMDNITYNRR